MPYTPPGQQSPSSSRITSPSISRAPSSVDQSKNAHRSPTLHKPSLPRSTSSTAYLNRARRSPSFQNDTPPASSDAKHGAENAEVYASSLASSLRQSPPPRTDSVIPSGAVMSPPDSTANSSDDEDSHHRRQPLTPDDDERGRGRLDVGQMQEFEEAYRRNKQDRPRGASPSGSEPFPPAAPALNGDAPADAHIPPRPRLSEAARKISHSRSNTASSILDNRLARSQSMSEGSEEEGEDDDLAPRKPPLVRKKSGELVKPAIRPHSRRKHSSMPGTPTFSKAVHFNEDIEQVRHFLQVDKPIAVSAGASPAEGYEDEHEFPFYPASTTGSDLEIHVRNFPRDDYERMANPVRLENITLASDQNTLVGTVACANLAFNKLVIARFTFDYWRTTSEVVAEYSADPAHKTHDGEDHFVFNIKLVDQANLESKTLLICVKYNVNGCDHWDNNKDMNYQVDFTKKPKPVPARPAVQPSAVRAIPRSKQNSPGHNKPRAAPSLDDDFGAEFDGGSSIRFRNAPPAKHILSDTPVPRKTPPSSQAFGSRYDFGASLTAALTKAQATLGERSGIKNKQEQRKAPIAITNGGSSLLREQPPSSALHTNTPAPAMRSAMAAAGAEGGGDSPRADALLASKQSLDSRAYQEFVSKFCFVRSLY